MLNDILDQMDYRNQSGYNDKGCIHLIERSSIACNKIPCLFYAIDLEREKDKETIEAVIHSICHQIDAFSGEYKQSSFQRCHLLLLLTNHFHKSLFLLEYKLRVHVK